jgi:Tfp pilus assembly protein PilZ
MGSLAVDGTEVTFVGRVAWVKPGDMNLNIPSRLGVSFARPPPGLEALIAPARPTVA